MRNWSLWMVVIFLGSSHSNVVLSESPSKDNLMKNLGHIIEYALLGFLIFSALSSKKGGTPTSRYVWLWSLTGAILYGVTDEVHQMFVPTRTAYLGDILMDGAGAGMGLLFGIIVYTFLSGKFFPSPQSSPHRVKGGIKE